MGPVTLARRILGDSGCLDTYRLRPRLNLAALLKDHGLEWHRHPFTDLAGALVKVDGEYRIVTNSRDSWGRQRFTAAHELKHFLTDRRLSTIFSCSRHGDGGIERAANAFARDLLMPEETVYFLVQERGICNPQALGRILGVSTAAMSLRMAELRLAPQQALWTRAGR